MKPTCGTMSVKCVSHPKDVDFWHGIREVCSIVDHNKRPNAPHTADSFGNMHVLLFGDFKPSEKSGTAADI